MFSISPSYVINYSRPELYDVFDDFYYPFSSYSHLKEQPDLFRSLSFRQPSRDNRRPRTDDEFDCLGEFFGLRKTKQLKQHKEVNEELRPNENLKQQIKKSDEIQTLKRVKELDSTRLDTDKEIEFRFDNYRCNDPSGVNVKITKDDYIVLETKDGYSWRNKIPNDVGDIEKSSCTLLNGRLVLRLPKKTADSQLDKHFCVQSNKIVATENDVIKKDQNDNVTNNQKVKSNNDEFDPDAPIVEDVYEDETY